MTTPQIPPGPPPAAVNELLGLLGARQWAAIEVKARPLIQRYPDHFFAWKILGAALQAEGRLDEAAKALSRAVTLAPNDPLIQMLLGNTLRELRRKAEAEACFRRALALKPDWPEALNNLGTLLRELGREAEAEACLGRALQLNPRYADAYYNLGNLWLAELRVEEAEECFRRALALRTNWAGAHNNLGNALREQGREEEAMAEFERAVQLEPRDYSYFKQLTNWTSYRDDFGPAERKSLYDRFSATFNQAGATRLPAVARPAGERLRIGYLSVDLHQHPVATNLLPVIRAHDRATFDIHFFQDIAKPDPVTAEFRALADGWHDIGHLSDEEVANLIRAQGIDILVSLAGRFDLNRPLICAFRAAPVQISLHEVATSGLAEMDYVIGDPWLIPARRTEFFCERPLRLPHFYIADLPAELPDLVSEPVPGPPIFGCFNTPIKISPTILDLWGRILAAMPEAKLRLKYMNTYRLEKLRDRLGQALVRAGAMPEQIEFLVGDEALPQHLERYNQIDVALDTYPFCGSTTSFQTMVMGVPLVTLLSDRMAGRWTASMLDGIGMREWIAATGEEYVAIALELARDRDAWRARRPEMRARLAASPLCDGPKWTRNIERLYRAVWRRAVDATAS